jgi:alpha-tubulin suppressor-like RCC1 family protein
MLATGDQNHLAIDKNGKVWGWGANSSGQLGDNSITSKCTPVSVAGTAKTFCKIDSGGNSSTGIDKNGKLWAWGENSSGQIGDGTTILKSTPVSVVGAALTRTFCHIAGYSTRLTIDKDGKVWAWGNNSYGTVGDNTTISKLTPVALGGATKTFCVIKVKNQALAIDKNGKLWGWGYNAHGQVGDNSVICKSTPVAVGGTNKTFCKIFTGLFNSYGIDKNGKLWSWGQNIASTYLLGNGNISCASALTPVAVGGALANKVVCEIAGGRDYAFAIDSSGKVWSWGWNGYGGLGVPYITSITSPISIGGTIRTFCSIQMGYNSTILGQHAAGIDKNGQVWSWGYNSSTGEYGDNSSTCKATPVCIAGAAKTFCFISSNGSNTVGIDKNGKVWGWGANSSGQLGNNTATGKCTPVSVAGTTKTFCKIATSGNHTMGIDKNGKAWGWGSNTNGRLGDNTITARSTPVAVAGAAKTFCKIEAGAQGFTIAIDKNGKAWSWGNNSSNAYLGDGTTTSRRTPVAVYGSKTFCEISTKLAHTMAIDKNGKVWGWGINSFGQLGNGSTIRAITPVGLLGANKTFCKIAAGLNFTVAIDKAGRLWSWGQNQYGQLANGTATSRSTPVSVVGATKTFCQVMANGYSGFAIDKNGIIWGWGLNVAVSAIGASNLLGLGNSSVQFSSTPIRVCNI